MLARRALSPRELEMFHLICNGATRAQAAEAMGVKYSTVRTMMERVYRKLRVHNISLAVMAAAERGILP